MTDCPDPESLSQFIEGKLAPDARDCLATHLGDCEGCYATLYHCLVIREELESELRKRRRKHLLYAIPASIAAAAVLVLAVRVLRPESGGTLSAERAPASRVAPVSVTPPRKPEPAAAVRSYAAELSKGLAGKVDAAQQARTVGNDRGPEPAYGFSSIVPLDKTVFRIGVGLVDLELALQAKDRASGELIARKVVELLKSLGSSHGPLPALASQGPGRQGGATDGLAEFSGAVEAMFRDRPESVYLDFGAWVEAAAFAADTRDASFFRRADIRRFRQRLELSGVPIGTLKNLSSLEESFTSDGIRRDRLKSCGRLLADIKEMF